MDPAIVVAVLSLVGSITIGTLAWLRDRRKTELDAEVAAAAQSTVREESSVALALKLRDEAMEERAAVRKETREEVGALRREIDTLRTEVHGLKSMMETLRRDRDNLVRYLRTLWQWVETGAKPPPPPVPDHLHELLPPREWTWPHPTDPV